MDATTISINDATPTAHVFNPVSQNGNLWLLRNTAGASTSATEEQIGLSLSRANANRATDKVKITLAVPHEKTVDGVIQTRDVARLGVDVTLPDAMTATERADFYELCKNLLANAIVESYISDRESMW